MPRTEPVPNSRKLFINTRDVMKLRCCIYFNAWREMRTIADALGKPSIKSITIYDYASFHDITVKEICSILGIKEPFTAQGLPLLSRRN